MNEDAAAGAGMGNDGKAGAGDFQRDASHWLRKLSPDEWIRAAMGDLRRAEAAYREKNPRAGLAGARRAAGMALNGALLVEPNEGWGRSYVDHLLALSRDTSVPDRVRECAKILLETPLVGDGGLVALRSASGDERVLEAARDVIAHGFAVVKRNEPLPPNETDTEDKP